MEFMNRIKSLRLDMDMSQAQLAAKLNKSESAIRMWEAGKSKPDADTLISLSTMFNCSADYLLGISDFVKPQALEDYNGLFLELSEELTLLNDKIRKHICTALIRILKTINFDKHPEKDARQKNLVSVLSALSFIELYFRYFSQKEKKITFTQKEKEAVLDRIKDYRSQVDGFYNVLSFDVFSVFSRTKSLADNLHLNLTGETEEGIYSVDDDLFQDLYPIIEDGDFDTLD